MNAYTDAFRKYADFSGRASVWQYWGFVIINFLVAMATLFLIAIHEALVIVYFLYLLATIVPSLSVMVRRLHDTNKSGWFILFGFVPVIGGLILLVFTLLPGDKEANQYGAPSV